MPGVSASPPVASAATLGRECSIIRNRIRYRLRAILGLCVLATACGGHSGPMGPTPSAPQITCPADITVSGVTASSQAVSFPAPTVTGGAAPVQTTCTPESGHTFPLGATPVTCTAKDAASQQASCAFNVVLKGFAIAVTRYGTYGDSLTEGENGLPSPSLFAPLFLDVPNAYPTRLQQSFDATYPGQGIVVINRGHSGDYAEMTYEKLKSFLPVDKPDAVLLITGYNDLLNGGCKVADKSTAGCNNAVTAVTYGVRDCIRAVKESGLGIKYIFVSTLTPPGPYLGGVTDRRIRNEFIVSANNGIKQMVAAEHATLVDTYPLFLGHEADYIEADGLHLSPAGNQALSDSFFSVIQATVPQTPLAAGRIRQ